MSRRRPCAVLGLGRSRGYDPPVPVSAEARQRRRWLDEPDTAAPLAGVRRMTAWRRRWGSAVHPQRVRRRQMGLAALSPRPRLSQPAAGHARDPSLWRGVPVTRITQGWSAARTEMRWWSGCVSVVAVREWCRRSVRSWALSSTRAVRCGVAALEQAWPGGRPERCHTAPGAPLTSQALTARRQAGGVQSRREGRGRALDHGCVARWWRSVKDAAVDLRDDHTVWDARPGLARSGVFDHGERRHPALGDRTPAAIDPGWARGQSLARAQAVNGGA